MFRTHNEGMKGEIILGIHTFTCTVVTCWVCSYIHVHITGYLKLTIVYEYKI